MVSIPLFLPPSLVYEILRIQHAQSATLKILQYDQVNKLTLCFMTVNVLTQIITGQKQQSLLELAVIRHYC